MIIAQVKCGTERWDVKILSDKDTVKIDFSKKYQTTVHQQVSLSMPDIRISEHLPRMSGETNVYTLVCYLIEYKKEKDKDVHLVIMDLNTGETMVAEIPGSECSEIRRTSRYFMFVNLNNWFISNIGRPTSKFKKPGKKLKIQITGVGFFDFIHGQKGMAANGREIHPVLEMKIVQ